MKQSDGQAYLGEWREDEPSGWGKMVKGEAVA